MSPPQDDVGATAQVTNTRAIDTGANIFSTQLRLDDWELRTKVWSYKMYLSISFRKSIPPQSRQLNVSMINAKRQVHDFVGELTSKN